MEYFYYFPIAVILMLGIITSYTDIKFSKIRNKHLIIFFCCGIIFYSFCILFKKISLNEIKVSLINFVVGIFIAFFLWYAGSWSAGDAKLFSLYVFILPLFFYQIKSNTFLTLFLNVVIPAALFLAFLLIYQLKIKDQIVILKKFISYTYLTNIILLIFSVGWLSKLMLFILKVPSNFILSMILIMGIDALFRKFLKSTTLYLYIGIAIIRFFIERNVIFSVSFWLSFLLHSLGYAIFRSFIIDISLKVFSKDTSIHNLKPGMIAAENIISNVKNNNTNYIKVPLKGFFSTSQFQNKDFLLNQSVEGLSSKEIQFLKSINISSLKIQQTMPFAPFMFLSALIVIFFGIDIISLCYLIFK